MADDPESARQRRIADACLVKEGVAPGRLGVYRRLIQGNLGAVARRLLPRSALLLDSAASDLSHTFDGWFARFLDEAGPRTPYLRDVPIELVTWATPLWVAEGAPAELSDLARHEVELFLVESAPTLPLPALAEVGLDRALVFASARQLTRYDHAVHEAHGPIRRRPTHLLLHRDEENTVHTTVLSEPHATLLAALLAGATLGDALVTVGLGSAEARSEVAAWLGELGATGALLGALEP